MRTTIIRTTLLLAAGFGLAGFAQAQDDSTSTRRNTLELGVHTKRGPYAQVKGKDDTAQEDKPDTITFQTKRKIITILTERLAQRLRAEAARILAGQTGGDA